MTSIEVFAHFGPQVLAAILCGGLVGLERELKNKPAGIKTNILICMGATILTSVSVLIATKFADKGHLGDPARIAAQIVPGIGFLGGGTIIQARGTILGLTTAATIWVVAAIGIVIGIGYPAVGVGCAVLVVGVLVLTGMFEDRIIGRSSTFACEIVVDDPEGKARHAINEALVQNDLVLEDFDLNTRGTSQVLALTYSGHRKDNKKFVLELWGLPGIREVKQL